MDDLEKHVLDDEEYGQYVYWCERGLNEWWCHRTVLSYMRRRGLLKNGEVE